MDFKTDRLKEDWYSDEIDPRLFKLLNDLDAFCADNNIPEPFVTEVLREPQHTMDQHWPGEAVDIRARQNRYTAQQLAMMDNYVSKAHWRKDKFDSGRPYRSFFAHGKGNHFHIHLSVDYNWQRWKAKQSEDQYAV